MNNRNRSGWVAFAAVVVFVLLVALVACRQPASGPDMAAPSTGFGYLNVDGALKVAVPTNAGTATPAVNVNNAGIGRNFDFQDSGVSRFYSNNEGSVVLAGPTAAATAVPAFVVNHLGVGVPLEVQKAATRVFAVAGNGDTTIGGTIALTGALTVGTSGAGADVTFYSATAGDLFLWDASEEKLVVTGTNAQTAFDVADGNLVVTLGNFDFNGVTIDADATGGINLDADTASNFNTLAGDITIEAETGSVVIKGDEAAVDAITLDANEAATTGITMATGATSGYALTGGPFDVNVTGGISLDADLASNINTAAGDITIEAEVASVTIKGDESAADAVYLDADDVAGSGVTIAVGATGGLNIGGGLTDIGVGTYATADGDNDLGVAGDFEVDGATDLDGTLSVAGATTAAAVTTSGDVTVSADATGGNALAVNRFIGVPRIAMAGLGTMANGSTNTVLTDIGDSETPATDWTAVDGDTVMSNDTTYFRQGTASLKMAVAATADDGDGCTNALASGDQDWTDDEGFGFWFMATKALALGDITLQIHDATAGGGFTDVNLPAYTTPNVWVWVELDVTLSNNNLKDVITDLSFTLSAAGAAQALAGAFDVYFDFIVKWDVGEEEALPVSILTDGVLSVIGIDVTSGGAATTALTPYVDYFVHFQSGADAIVMITDQSATDLVGIALYAY